MRWLKKQRWDLGCTSPKINDSSRLSGGLSSHLAMIGGLSDLGPRDVCRDRCVHPTFRRGNAQHPSVERIAANSTPALEPAMWAACA